MLLIHCPYCQEDRPELEFHGAGEAHIERPQNIAEITDAEFEKFFFIRENRKGLVFERWRHLNGCGRFFNAVRHSVSDKFICTYKAGDKKPKITDKQIAAVLPPAKIGKTTPTKSKAKNSNTAKTNTDKAMPPKNMSAKNKSTKIGGAKK